MARLGGCGKTKKADRLVCLVWYWVGESNSYYKIENLGY